MKRRKANGRYSLRSFARQLGMSPASASLCLRGKRHLPRKAAERFATSLDEERRGTFVLHYRYAVARSPLEKEILAEEMRKKGLRRAIRFIGAEDFQRIFHWYHLTLLEILRIGNASKQVNEIQNWVDLATPKIRRALRDLEKLGLVTRSEKSAYSANQENVQTTDGVSSSAVRNFHREILSLAQDAIEKYTVNERYLNTSTLLIDRKDLPKAAKVIADFHERFARKFQRSGASGNDVYALSVQYFPLTRSERRKEPNSRAGT